MYAEGTRVFVCVAGTRLLRTHLKRIRDYRSLLCKYIILRSLWRVSCGVDQNRYGYIPKNINVLFVKVALCQHRETFGVVILIFLYHIANFDGADSFDEEQWTKWEVIRISQILCTTYQHRNYSCP